MNEHDNSNHKRPTGVAFGLLSAILFGLSTPLAKMLLGEIQPLALAGLLYLGSGLGLTILWLMKRRRSRKRGEGSASLKRSDWPYLSGAIVFGGMLSPALLMSGLSLTMASTASLLLNLEAVLTAVIAWVAFKENCDRRIVAGMVAIVAGGAILSVVGQGGFALSWGCALIVLACLGWAVDNNLTRQISHADATQIALLKGLAAGAVNLTLAFIAGNTLPGALSALGALTVGFFGYGLSLVLFVLALRHLGTARTGAYFSTAPFAGAIFAIAAMSEPLTWNFAVAAALMGTGVWLHLTEHHEHVHFHEELVHEHEHVHDEHHRHSHSSDDRPGEPHTHVHRHEPMSHSHPHYPDLHHRHEH